MGGLAGDHLESCEFPAAAGTFHVAFGPVFSDAVQKAFDEAARPIFAVLVQEAAALQTADGDGSVFASQSPFFLVPKAAAYYRPAIVRFRREAGAGRV